MKFSKRLKYGAVECEECSCIAITRFSVIWANCFVCQLSCLFTSRCVSSSNIVLTGSVRECSLPVIYSLVNAGFN